MSDTMSNKLQLHSPKIPKKKRKLSKNSALNDIFNSSDQRQVNESQINESSKEDQSSASDSENKEPPYTAKGANDFDNDSKEILRTNLSVLKCEEDKANSVVLNQGDLKTALKLLKSQPKSSSDKSEKLRLKLKSICQDGRDPESVHWQSSTFTMRAIRNLILNRDWDHLKELLRIMMKHKTALKNYVKELTYLYFLINSDRLDPMQIENFFLFCFASSNTNKKIFKEFDIWFKQDEPANSKLLDI